MIKIIPYTTYKPVTEYAVEEQMKSAREGEQTVFIVPESVKASVERLVFDRLVKGRSSADDIKTSFGPVSAGTLDIDVLSFVRLSYKILTMTGSESYSDDSLLRNVIYRILTDSPSDFPNFNRLRRHFEYVDMLVDLIGDFHRYGIKPEKIEEVISSEGDTDGKLSEMMLLMRRADEMGKAYGLPVDETLPDAAAKMIMSLADGVNPRFKQLSSFVKSRFIIMGLGSTRNLTPQERRLVKALSDAGAEVIVYAAIEDEDDGSFGVFGRSTIASLEEIGGFVCEPVSFLSSDENRLNVIARSYAMGDMDVNVSSMPEDDSVELLSYAYPDDAVSYIANEINRLVRVENKYRYSDIRILCVDDSYKDRIKSIFRLFDLQAFIDKKVILLNTPVVRFVTGLLDLSIYNYDANSVLKILRTGVLTGARSDLVDVFDNYLLRENIMDRKRLFNEDFYKLVFEVDGEQIRKDEFKIYDNGKLITDGPSYLYENIVKKVLLPISKITDEIDAKTTIAGKAGALAGYIGSLKTEVEELRNEFLDRGDQDTALAIVKGYTEVMSLLSSLTGDLNEVEITPEQFASLIKTDMKNKASGSIPLCADSVQITSVESSVYTSCKVLYVVGATAENFPHKSSREGIIPSAKLRALGLPDKAQMRSKQEFVEASLLLNCASDKLCFITPATDMPSQVFTYIRRALQEGDDEYPIPTGGFETPVYGMPVDRRHDALDDESCYITSAHMHELLAGRNVCSVSSIEKYNSCPLQYMLDHALRIKVRTDGTKIEGNEFGSLSHSMFEFAMSDVKKELETKTIDQLIAEAVPEKIGKLADDYFRRAVEDEQIKNPDKFSNRYAVYPGLKVKRIFSKAYPAMLDYYKESGYRPEAFEVKVEDFDHKIDIKTTSDGIEFEFKFRGSIDRVDKNEDGLLRVVDYKSYAKDIDFKKAADGVQIQLFAYAYGLKLQPGNEVDNVGYIGIYLPTKKPEKNKPPKLFEYKSADKKYDLDAVIDYAGQKLKDTCDNIAQGKGTAKLTGTEFDKACTFCNFKGSCGRLMNSNDNPGKAEAAAIADSWKKGK